MQQQITRGDYLEDLITIYIENNLQQNLDDLYDMFVFQCGEIQKQITPAPVIKISFTEQESQLLTNYNTCYLAGITKEGHKETFNGSISFNTRGEVVYYEPTPNGSLQASSTSTIACPCTGISGVFANCTQPAIKAYFSINYVPTKLSELQNDTDFQDSVDVANSIAAHNASESAHPYIQSVLASTTEAIEVEIGDLTSLTTSDKSSIVNAINSEVSDRVVNVSNAIVTTEAYTDSIVSVNTEATKAYADSIVQGATTAINTTIGDLDNLDTANKSSVVNAINSEVTARENADNNLQTQIDGLAAASDVTDIVGTYQELQNYDTQHLNNNDIIKVLSDETHDDEPSYYRFNKTAGTFSYIGSESASYTKAQSDSIFVTQTTTINGKALSSDISLTYSDVSALPLTTQTIIDAHTSAIATNTSAIASNTSVIAQHTTAIASNTSDISTINGKIPTDASTSNKLVSASTLAASIADFANQDLSNLTENGEGRLHALKSYADKGELLTDPDGLAFVEKYNKSTFDASKFTKVGSPIVTSDGIASGFSSSNYIKNSCSYSGVVECKVKITYIKFTSDYASPIVFGVNASSLAKLNIVITKSNDNIQISGGTGSFALTENQSYNLKVTTDCLTYINLYINDTLVSERILTLDSKCTITEFSIGSNTEGQYPFTGSIDLKQFSITVDGVPVFSGNKTGIDTVKPSNFTAITSSASSPFVNPSLPFSQNGLVITADGIASGFSSSNYLTTNGVSITQNTNFIIEMLINIPTTISNAREVFLKSLNSDIALQISINSSKILQVYSGGTQTTGWKTIGQLSSGLNLIKLVKDGSTFTFYSNDISIGSFTNSNLLDIQNFYVGSRIDQYYFTGSIDLNAFKIYVDGDLVYQPCLKIPYTESKTGSKIVDAVYRDRANDMAEQFGYANYYTLSDTDFTLPQVELYGLIGQRTLRDSYRNGATYWELWSDRTLEIGGTCTSGVEYNLPRNFTSENDYILSVPYSAKTASSFTPTVSGDFIAKGLGVL